MRELLTGPGEEVSYRLRAIRRCLKSLNYYLDGHSGTVTRENYVLALEVGELMQEAKIRLLLTVSEDQR